jgi:iron complex outermembrane receptor protein
MNTKRFFGYIDISASVRNVFDSQGKEPAGNGYPDNFPRPSRSFYLETTIKF